MKTKSFTVKFLALFLFVSALSLAQVPNGDFESWTNGNPTGWTTDNSLGVGTPITQTSDAHGGASAARGEVLNVFGIAYPGYLWSIGQNGKGFAVDKRYAQLTGYYKLDPKGNDKFLVWIVLWSKDQGIAANYGQFGAASSYTQFTVPIIYATADTPDSASIWILVSPDTSQTSLAASIGTIFFVDDLSLTGTATGVEDNSRVLSYKIEQNYPNPFNPSTTIRYSIPEADNVTINIFDITGKLITTLMNQTQNAGTYEVTWDGKNNKGVPAVSGIYLYKIKAGNFTKISKMILLK